MDKKWESVSSPVSFPSYVGRRLSSSPRLLLASCRPTCFPSVVSQDLCTNAVRQSSGPIRCSSIIYKCSKCKVISRYAYFLSDFAHLAPDGRAIIALARIQSETFNGHFFQ